MDVESITPDQILDTKGLSCPMPLLKTKKAINSLNSGQILEVLGTDPGSKNDLPNWCDRSGHLFLGDKEGDGFFRFFIRKG
ncbi:MAG: sulfurtransferase TusA family protein [Deltaproteobacteria bacterium]|jgi:tRNA 2-thiouridine synthesizing protein A|nr:sulfurtransferase TusA family protein [Deltaproteobacteria bacterium]